MVTPTGHLLVWHRWDWMQPTANMNARAELHQSVFSGGDFAEAWGQAKSNIRDLRQAL